MNIKLFNNSEGIKRINVTHLDDRSYTLAMAAYGLAEERRKLILNRKPNTDHKSLVQQLTIRRGSFGGKTI